MQGLQMILHVLQKNFKEKKKREFDQDLAVNCGYNNNCHDSKPHHKRRDGT